MQASETVHNPDDSLEEQNRRLETLVADLLKTNQELRFRLTSLEDAAERQKRGEKNAPPWAGMLI